MRRRLCVMFSMMLMIVAACSSAPLETVPTSGTAGAATTATTETPTTVEPVPRPSTTAVTASQTTAAESSTSERSLGVVLIDPLLDDGLNLREWPGVGGPILARLHRTQTKLIPTGRTSPVDGRPWYEITVGEITGWVHGRYITETWQVADIEQTWDWRTALGQLAEAFATGEGLADAVTWRGFYAVDGAGGLHWWKPSHIAGLVTDQTRLRWNFVAATWEDTGLIHTFADVVSRPFLADYYDPDTVFTVGGLPLGPGAISAAVAVSTAFQNFAWVAVHDPMDDPEFGGMDWDTWLVYLELDGTLPKVVGLQRHHWEP